MGRDLTSGSVFWSILSASWPMMVAFSLQSAFNIADAFFVGKISAAALAAVSVSFPIVFLIISLSTGVGAGTTSLIARYVGAKDFRRAGEVAEHGLLLGFVLAVFFAVFGVLTVGFLFDLMGISPDVREPAVEYIHVILAGSPLMFMAMVGNSVIRGEGEMKFPMYAMASAAVLNIILDPLFIFTFGWGVAGAAFATVVARTIALIIISGYLVSERTWIKPRFRKFVLRVAHVKGIFQVGLPSSLSNLSMSAGMFLFTAIVAGFGTEALAAFGIGFRLDSIALLPSLGVSVAVVSLVGQNVGARKYARAEEMTFKAGFMAIAFMTVIGLAFMLFPETIVSVFNKDPLVVSYGVEFLKIIPLSYLFVGLSMAISGAFLGSGHAIPALTLNVLRVIVLSVPLAYILSHSMGLSGVWWGILVGSAVATIIAVLWFKSGSWKKHAHKS